MKNSCSKSSWGKLVPKWPMKNDKHCRGWTEQRKCNSNSGHMRCTSKPLGTFCLWGWKEPEKMYFWQVLPRSAGSMWCHLCSGRWQSLSQSTRDGALLFEAMKEGDAALWGWVLEAQVGILRVIKVGRGMAKRKATGPPQLLWQRARYLSLLASPCLPGLWWSRKKGPVIWPLPRLLCSLPLQGRGSAHLNMKLVASLTLGIFLFFLPFCGSPRLKKVSSGLLGVEGGLILEGDPVPSRLSFLVSSSLKFLLSEFCRKKAGLDKECCEGRGKKKSK